MPWNTGSGSRRLRLPLVVAVLVLGFTPISRVLLRAVNGSFTPTRYSSLALEAPADAVEGVLAGEPVPVRLSNHTGRTTSYHWSATQRGTLISLGEETIKSGRTITFLVPSTGSGTGRLQIELTGSNVFVTVPMLKS
jgi:hypothetical protein